MKRGLPLTTNHKLQSEHLFRLIVCPQSDTTRAYALDCAPRGRQIVYLVVDDLGRLGQVWREADVEHTDLETVILDLLEGQYKSPVRIVAFNTAEKWSQDVSEDIAQERRRRCDLQLRDIPFFLQEFVDRYEGRYRDIQLPLPLRLV